MKHESLYEKIAKGVGDAIVDVREKVVEEGWYGRVVNERESLTVQWPEARDAQSISSAEPEHSHEPEQDFDR